MNQKNATHISDIYLNKYDKQTSFDEMIINSIFVFNNDRLTVSLSLFYFCYRTYEALDSLNNNNNNRKDKKRPNRKINIRLKSIINKEEI